MTAATDHTLRMRTSVVLRLRECAAYAADLRGASAAAGKTNVLIFGQGRSGTTLFEELMVSTGQFTGLHEVLNTVTREVYAPTRYVRGLGRARRADNVILHVKPEHLGKARRTKGPVDAREFLESLVADGWHIVHIQRRDLLRQLISKFIAQSRGQFHKTDDHAESIAVHVPEDAFVARYEQRLGLAKQEAALLDGLPHYSIVYETHLESEAQHQQTIDDVFDWLGLPHQQASTRLRKIASASPASQLENANALRDIFNQRGWEWTL